MVMQWLHWIVLISVAIPLLGCSGTPIQNITPCDAGIQQKAILHNHSATLIFFARGSAEPLAFSLRSLDAFVFEACHDKTPTVMIQGNIDTSEIGLDEGLLGRERALAVQRLLLESGLHMKEFRIVDFGSHRPLVPTGLDVSEPQNRRVALIKDPAP